MTSLVLEAECLLRGLVVGYSALSGVLRILPPLVITEAEIDEACGLLDEAATHIVEQPLDLSRYLPSHTGSMQLAMGFLNQLAGS